MSENGILIDVRHLSKVYGRGETSVKAVNDVSFTVNRGETLGIVGESGCGKSTLGRALLQLEPASAGEILYDGVNICGLKNREMAEYRRRMQIVFQDPYGSLNPRYRVGTTLGEPLEYHHLVKNRRGRDERVAQLLEMVGLRPEDMKKYPHEFSGGQRQRIGIARALSVHPEFLICDEPVSALDVSVQSQILNLLSDVRREMDLTMIFIAHGINVVKHISDRVAVMYLGRIMEIGQVDEVLEFPVHPYTRALLSAVPEPHLNTRKEPVILEGELPSPMHPPAGCPFCTRCPYATDRCRSEVPVLRDLGNGHQCACLQTGSAEQ